MKTRSVRSCALLCVYKAYFTKEIELPSTSVSYATGSNPGHPGQWVIRVSGSDPVSTLICNMYSRVSKNDHFTLVTTISLKE